MKDRRQKKRILAMGAHPDDIEYGCGGTLMKYKDLGHEVFLYILTDGSKAAPSKVRREEQAEAAKYIGVSQVFWGNFVDAELPGDYPIIQSIEKVMKEVQPDEVYVNYFEDTHQDHRKLARAAEVASRSAKKIFYYDDWSTLNLVPVVYVDIEDVIDRKKELLLKHASQVKRELEYNRNNVTEAVEATARFRGLQARIKNAEAFLPIRLIRDLI